MYAFFKSLILPPGSILLLIFLGLICWRRPWMGRGLVLLSALTLLFLSLPIVSSTLMRGLEPYPALGPAQLEHTGADSIVVLSANRDTDAPEYGADSVGDLTLQRLRYAAWLHHKTGLPLVVTGGKGTPYEDPSLAHLMRQVLEKEFAAPVTAMEARSTDTWENALFTAEVLKRENMQHILLVTHAWHLPRAVEAFERAGVRVTAAPTAFEHDADGMLRASDFFINAGAMRMSAYAIHEYLGRIWYRLRQYIEA